MLKALLLTLLCYVTGWLYIKLFSGKKYVISFADEMQNPFALGDLKKLEDGRTLARTQLVFFMGALIWFLVFLVFVVLYWVSLIDVITPLRFWLFGESLSPF